MKYMPKLGETINVHLYLSPEGKRLLKGLSNYYNETYSNIVSYLLYVTVRDNKKLQFLLDGVKGGELPLAAALDAIEAEPEPQLEVSSEDSI